MESVFVVKLVGAIMLLFGFGVWFNRHVARLEEEHGQHGYTALLVIGGELTIHAAALLVVWGSGIGPEVAVLVDLLLHAPAGVPMTLGSIGRHLRREQAEVQQAEGIARVWLRP